MDHSPVTNSGRNERPSDRGDAMLPETEMQLEMLLTKASETSRKSSADAEPQVLISQSKLIILEDRFTVLQKRNVVLIAENDALRNQLKESTDEIRELKDASKNSASRKNHRQVESTERAVQTSRSDERKLDNFTNMDGPTAIMTKSELERLENDTRRLRDLVATREADWEKATERENCYREQLKRLAAESMTSRQLSDARHAELERLAQTLAETEKDLRLARKEISSLKKIVAKHDKKHKELDQKTLAGSSETNEGEPESIDDIVRQLSSASSGSSSKQGSRQPKDRAIYTSAGTNNSNAEPAISRF